MADHYARHRGDLVSGEWSVHPSVLCLQTLICSSPTTAAFVVDTFLSHLMRLLESHNSLKKE